MEYEKMINDMLHHLVERFNSYGQLVAINRHNNHDEGILEWNRGNRCAYEEEAIDLARKLGRKVDYEMKEEKIMKDTPNEYTVEYRIMKISY